jgi:hypothetical protein
MTPMTQLATIGVREGRTALQTFRQTLTQNNPAARVYCAVHPEIGNIEFLAAINSDIGLAAPVPGLSEEDLARKFLIEHCELFRLRREVFTQHLVLKHTLHSLAGVHLTFELRAEDANQQGVPLNDACFVAHFDQRRRIVMISAVYEPEYTFDTRQLTPAAVEAKLPKVWKTQPPLDAQCYSLTPEFLLDPKTRKYRIGWRLKYLDQDHVTRYVLISNQKKIITSYTIDPTQPPYWGAGQVYQEYWGQRRGEPDTRRVALSDLTHKRALVGRYVRVEDRVNLAAFPPQNQDEPFEFVCDKNTSGFDRVMAYYHTNLVQHYFRELGLFELDQYPGLMPIRVVLSNGRISRYVVPDVAQGQDRLGWIILNRLDEPDEGKGKEWTQAREARVIYHEFTHAVTDALARLHRGNQMDEGYQRRVQVLQAAAMDEALGDYFACSLAARAGVAQPTFGILEIDNAQLPKWTELRNLMPHPSSALAGRRLLRFSLKPDEVRDAPIYRWGKLWASYLWQLRCDSEIGPDNADRLIANSLFFLTRWTTGVGGLLALLLADVLLFNGVHLNRIQELARERGVNIAKYELGR